jgi:uncharacterized RDD family membrane protein YckC
MLSKKIKEELIMENKNAGIVIRALAATLDMLIIMNVLTLPLVYFAIKIGSSSENILFQLTGPITYIISAALLTGVLAILYNTYFLSHFGATVGKMLFGIKVVDQESNKNIDFNTAFLRTVVGYSFSSQFFGLGFLRIPKNMDKLGWHDELFNTKVIKTKSPLIGIVVILLTIVLLGIQLGTIVNNVMGLIPTGLPSLPNQPGLPTDLIPTETTEITYRL